MPQNAELFWKMRRVDALFRRALYAVAEQQGVSFELGHGHGKLLHFLTRRDGVSQKELAEALHIRPQSLTSALVKLEEQGLITRVRSEKDKREQFVSITERGREHYELLRHFQDEAAKLVLSGLDVADTDRLSELLGLIIDNCTNMEENGLV